MSSALSLQVLIAEREEGDGYGRERPGPKDRYVANFPDACPRHRAHKYEWDAEKPAKNQVRDELRLPKSGKIRSVPLIDQAAKALDQISRREHFVSPSDLVFPNDVGSFLDDRDLRLRFYGALKRAGLSHKRLRSPQGPPRSASMICATRSARSPCRLGLLWTCRRTWATPTSTRR